MYKILFTIVFAIIATLSSEAQNIGVGTKKPHSSSILDIQSTTMGALVPRMTEAQRNLITNPAVGLLIYNTSENCLNFFSSANNWISLCNKP